MNTLGMFARLPEPGKTKTRLAAAIGDAAASDLYAAFVEDLITRCQHRTEEFVLAATPQDDRTTDWFEKRLKGAGRLQFQPDGNLGDRIEWFFRTSLRTSEDTAVLIGSDSPDLPSEIIDAAFVGLQAADMVLSPASDGGFVLIGLSRLPQRLFETVTWSTPATLLDTLAAAQRQKFSVTLLRPWYDIDTVENLGALLALQQSTAAGAAACPGTRTLLLELWPQIQRCWT